MKTANKYFNMYRDKPNSVTESQFIKAINEARIDAIKECAEMYVLDGNPQTFRDKILSLINEVK